VERVGQLPHLPYQGFPRARLPYTAPTTAPRPPPPPGSRQRSGCRAAPRGRRPPPRGAPRAGRPAPAPRAARRSRRRRRAPPPARPQLWLQVAMRRLCRRGRSCESARCSYYSAGTGYGLQARIAGLPRMPPPALQSQVQGHSGSQAAQARACSAACTSPRSASRPLAKPGTAASSWTVAFTKQWFWWPGLVNPGGGRHSAAESPGWCGAAGTAASRQSARRDLCSAQAPCGCAASAGGPGRSASRGACAAGAGLRGGEAGCRTRRAASLTASPAACAARARAC